MIRKKINFLQNNRPILNMETMMIDIIIDSNIKFDEICKKYKLDEDVIIYYFNYVLNEYGDMDFYDDILLLKLDTLLFYQSISENTIIKIIEKMQQEINNFKLDSIIESQHVSVNFLKKYNSLFNWDNVWVYQELSELEIEEFIQYVNWKLVSQYQQLSIPFIMKYMHAVDWFEIYKSQQLTEEFIELMGHKTYWDVISSKQRYLSEEFIEKHANDVNWKNINKYQKNISKEFLNKHKGDIMISKSLKGGYKKQRCY